MPLLPLVAANTACLSLASRRANTEVAASFLAAALEFCRAPGNDVSGEDDVDLDLPEELELSVLALLPASMALFEIATPVKRSALLFPGVRQIEDQSEKKSSSRATSPSMLLSRISFRDIVEAELKSLEMGRESESSSL